MLNHYLLWPISALTILALPAAATASDTATAQAADNSEDKGANSPNDSEIIVTGTLLARQKALDVKKEDVRVIEVLGADELSQFPDKNIGESLNRLPGVSMLVEKGEARYVQIRGVAANLNNVTINGLQMGSPEIEDGGRQAPLDMISASMLSRVEVFKTPTPDMDGQGIGGTVNVITAMPFDRRDSLYGASTARVGRESIRPRKDGYGGHDPWAVDGMLSGKLAGDRFGWLVAGSYSKREYTPIGIYQDDWDDSTGAWLPVNVKNNYYVVGRERLNLNGALEFRPDGGSRYFIRSFYSAWNEYQHRNRYEQNFTAGIIPNDDHSGISGANRVRPNIRLEHADKRLFSITPGGHNELGPLTLDYVAQYNHNWISEPNDFWEWQSRAIFGPNRFQVGENGVVTITPDAGTPNRFDPSLFALRRARFTDSDMSEKSYIAKFDAAYAVGEALTLKAGLKGAQTRRMRDLGVSQYDPGTTPLTLATLPGFTHGGFINETPAGEAPNIMLDIDAMNAFFGDPTNAAYFRHNSGVQTADDYSSDYRVKESIVAAYGMAAYRTDLFDLIGGLRVEHTKVDSRGFLLSGGSASEVKAGDSYTTLLPSLVANWRPADAWVVRGAITRALGRPGYDVIAPRSTFSDGSTLVGSLSVGNPGLKPRLSWNFDASVEFYPARATAIAVAAFRKEISDDFVSSTSTFVGQQAIADALTARGFAPGSVDISGLNRLAVSTTVNAGSTYIQGIELSAQGQFSFLPSPLDGFGASASATFLKGRTKLLDGTRMPVQEQPTKTYAASFFFQKWGIDASLSYKWNASFPTDLNDDPALNLDQGEFGRWDARLAYSVTPKIRLFVEGVNLNNEPTSEFQGGNRLYNTEYEYVGRSYYAGVTVGF